MATLRLGYFDSNIVLPDKNEFLDKYHHNMGESLKSRLQFRDESFNRWRDFKSVSDNKIRILQHFLRDAGFFPHAIGDGIFGYGTMGATRLFQEYVRTVEGFIDIGIPDGIAGKRTHEHINRWIQNGIEADWGGASVQNPSSEFRAWIQRIQLYKQHSIQNPSEVTRLLLQAQNNSDTTRPADWNTTEEVIHLIGVRRNAHHSSTHRTSDDLFFLLVNGMVFKGYGSTDPNPHLANRPDEPYLIPGQHKYRFGWHKKNKRDRVYKAMIPFRHGVYVIRDKNEDDALTSIDLPSALELPNPTINIHWSGDGRLNYSAGCQVISGKSYINHLNQKISCTAFAASGYRQLGTQKTKGAYNLFSDLITCFGSRDCPEIFYTLIPEEDLEDLDDEVNSQFLSELWHTLNP